MPIPKAQEVKLSDAERQELEKLTRQYQIGQPIALRARIVLAAAQGLKNKETVAKYSVTNVAISRLWLAKSLKIRNDRSRNGVREKSQMS